jgi:hypothetical protein
MDSITLENLKNLDKLQSADAHVKVNSYREGCDAACEYFKAMFAGEDWNDDKVHIRGGKVFDDERKGIQTVVYEAFVDSGSVDYFFFSFEREII